MNMVYPDSNQASQAHHVHPALVELTQGITHVWAWNEEHLRLQLCRGVKKWTESLPYNFTFVKISFLNMHLIFQAFSQNS